MSDSGKTLGDRRPKPEGVAATPAAEIKTGGKPRLDPVTAEMAADFEAATRPAPARRKADPEIATLAKLDALLADVAPDVAVRCLNWLTDKYAAEYAPINPNPEVR